LSVIYCHQHGKVRVVCTIRGCGWGSKFGELSAVNLDLAHHNYKKHPGVFPRWNPNVHAVEKTKGW